MFKNIPRFFIFLIFLILFISPLLAFALPLVPCGGDGQPVCSIPCFYVMIDGIINFLLVDIAFPLAATALMAAGIMMVLGGSERSISLGRDILKNTIIGLLLAFGAWVIINTILGNLLQENGVYTPWNRFPDSTCTGNQENPPDRDFGIDNTPPTTPSELAISVLPSGNILLNWRASEDPIVGVSQPSGVSGYRIYRDDVLIGDTSNTSFEDVGVSVAAEGGESFTSTASTENAEVSASAQYNYDVVAYDRAGNVSSGRARGDIKRVETSYSPFGFLGQYIDNSLTQQLNSAYGGYSAVQGFYKDIGVHWDRGAGRNGGAVWGAFKNESSDEYRTYPQEFDNYAAVARQNGINLLITIIPAYSRESQDDSINGKKIPADLDGFISFVKELVKNHPYIKYWQLDNEINNGVFWKDTPQNYAKLLRLTSDAIRETCPDCKVVLGSSINISGPGNPLPVEPYFEPILEELSNDGRNYFDIFDYHFFPPNGYTPESYYRSYAQGIASTRSLLDKYGYSGAEIWTTETMIPTTDGMSQSQIQKLFPEYRTITEKQQAKALFKTYVSGLSAGVKKIFWTKLTEGPVFDFMFNRAGLIRHPSQSGSTDKKLSYFAYKKMVEVLEGSDWNNIQTIQESDGVYVYKFIKNRNKQAWVAWNDNIDGKQITISDISSGSVKITESLPKYDLGKDVADYSEAFNTAIEGVRNNQVSITLNDKPVFIESIEAVRR